MLVTRGLGGVWPGAVAAGLGSYSGVIPPEPTPSGGGGGSKRPAPWRVDYLEDYPGYYRPEPAPVVNKKARAPRKVPQGPAQIVTPWELLNSFGLKPEQAPVIARPLVQAPAPAPKPIASRAEALAIIEQFRAARLAAQLAEAERLRLLRQRNAAAFLLLM
jgi:hypothetical protein